MPAAPKLRAAWARREAAAAAHLRLSLQCIDPLVQVHHGAWTAARPLCVNFGRGRWPMMTSAEEPGIRPAGWTRAKLTLPSVGNDEGLRVWPMALALRRSSLLVLLCPRLRLVLHHCLVDKACDVPCRCQRHHSAAQQPRSERRVVGAEAMSCHSTAHAAC